MPKHQFLLFAIRLLLLFAISCDSSTNSSDTSNEPVGDSRSDSTRDSASVGTDNEAVHAEDSGIDDGVIDATTLTEVHCPNNVFEPNLNEECDDGNYFDDDGCTRLCEYSCESDRDCDDQNSCNGTESCNLTTHACETGDWPTEGEACDINKSCFAGLCIDDRCGDGVVNTGLGEDCDDKNNVDDDGCTNRCTYGCTTDAECTNGDPCVGTTNCDTSTHKCIGERLNDKENCSTDSIVNGWCVKGVCVPTDCGNGVREGGEACDDGANNGTPGSECSIDCIPTVCGNGTIEGTEECDDGATASLDSCNKSCKAELFFRWTKLEVLREPSPEWCVHAGKNAFAEAFPGAVDVELAGLGKVTVDSLGSINLVLKTSIDNCSFNPISQILGMADSSLKTSDDSVEVVTHFGELDPNETCQNPIAVDTSFKLLGDTIVDGEPVGTIASRLRSGIIQSLEAAVLSPQKNVDLPGVGDLLDLKFLWQFDIENLSTPPSMQRDDGVEAIAIPQSMGTNPNPEETYHSSGRMCAAMSIEGLKNARIVEGSQMQENVCCSSAQSARGIGKYKACSADDPDGDCDSQLDIISNGCILCVDLTAVDSNYVSPDCGGGDLSGCSIPPIEVVRPSSPDVDTDGDQINDAFSIVLGVEGVRIQASGTKE